MKLFHEIEDCIVGLIVGLLMVGLSGYFIILPDMPVLWGLLFAISALVTIFDVTFTIFDLGEKVLPLIFLLLNNAIDIIIEIVLAAKYFGFSLNNIPLLGAAAYYLSQPQYLFWSGAFFIASSLFWIIATPIIWKEPHSKGLLLGKDEKKTP